MSARHAARSVMVSPSRNGRSAASSIRKITYCLGSALCLLLSSLTAHATPANRIGLERYYERFLSKKLNACTTCHLPPQPGKPQDTLQNFPHNSFGRRLAELGDQLRKERSRADIATRLKMVAGEDSDGDG